jgi:hypothetical protein
MGQAKSRGGREQRVAEALKLVEMQLSEVKKNYGLPADAEFLGYGVHIEKSDEFLAEYLDEGEITRKVWAKTPELAKRFVSIADAHDVSKNCKGSIVVGMFDTGDQIFVANITGLHSIK